MSGRVTRHQTRSSSSSPKDTEDVPSSRAKKRKTGSTSQGDDTDSKGSARKEVKTEDDPERPRTLLQSVKFDDSVLLSRHEIVSLYVTLDPLPVKVPRIPALNANELMELERAFEFNDDTETWRSDWAGNLALVDLEICNPKVKDKAKQSFRQTLLDWANKNSDIVRLVWNLMRLVCNFPETPEGAKKVLASADPQSLKSLELAIRRTTYDPVILQQDGWITAKSAERVGATGGPNLIGDLIRWQHYDAVIIAYDHDELIGDLWKAMWLDHDDFMSFDVEAEELLEAKRKWERRQLKQASDIESSMLSRRSTRFAVSSDFSVQGIEHGIVLARSLSKGARPGVFWPARIMHVSETSGYAGRRSSSKVKVDVVFLAPYWNSDDSQVRGRRVESLSGSGSSAFNAGSLLQFESIDVVEEMILKYPFDGNEGVDFNKIRTAFRFTGLPVAAFSRFLDSHRLALSLQAYAKRYLNAEATDTEMATAGLFDSHPMAVRTAKFPTVVLNLPFEHILSLLPHPDGEYKASSLSDSQGEVEPLLNLELVVRAMQPPQVFGEERSQSPVPNGSRHMPQQPSTPGEWLSSVKQKRDDSQDVLGFEQLFLDLNHLNNLFSLSVSKHATAGLLQSTKELFALVVKEKEKGESSNGSKADARKLIQSWATLKRVGDDVVALIQPSNSTAVAEWRRAAERLYKYLTLNLARSEDGLSVVLTDLRCNGHKTSTACFERSVRLPAALKGAKLAGATADGSPRLVSGVSQHFIDFVENEILRRAHGSAYVKRMKGRCGAAANDEDVVKLTDDSDGNGGEDTSTLVGSNACLEYVTCFVLNSHASSVGSRGTWAAAVCGVAAAVQAADMVVYGDCVNVFCATRPPGHHAGRALHPMKAVSNGFCVLNSVACAAVYATMPLHEGGLGLSRVCVIDFDAHHGPYDGFVALVEWDFSPISHFKIAGNGTQDILCATYDSRYLYVSLHAGGPEVNGIAHDDDPNHELHDLAVNKTGGIFPGRCGDTSPHKGVLNIPLGAKVTSHDVGTALVQHVSPAVEAFSPDLIILSTGFDAHKNDPMGLGSLSAEDFGHITEVACHLAFKTCSGRVISVLEGGYGVPCCREQRGDLFLPSVINAQGANALHTDNSQVASPDKSSSVPAPAQRPQPSILLDLGDDLPGNMDDQVPFGLQRRLEKCHAEGFVQCVRKHVESLARCNKRK